MLSILIPVFNFDVIKLVTDLDKQCQANDIIYEIRCIDDGSETEFKQANRILSEFPHIIYTESKSNLGRSAIRNKLAAEALYPYLFFLDCDSGSNEQFSIRIYLEHLDPEKILYGGRIYTPVPPREKELLLHWYYGKAREEKTAEQRKVQAYHSFMSNNFLIPKSIFSAIRFDETIRQYGHEDTLFGLELKKRGVEIIHLNNPLLHLGLENTERFLMKSKLAIYNLYIISKKNPMVETRLLNVFHKLKRVRLLTPYLLLYKLCKPLLMAGLRSQKPNLLLFDIFKIGELIQLSKACQTEDNKVKTKANP